MTRPVGETAARWVRRCRMTRPVGETAARWVRRCRMTRPVGETAELFASHGYVGTTTSALASAAGVNEVTLFRHFGSKEGVLRALRDISAAGRSEFPPAGTVVPDDLRATLHGLALIEIRDGIASGGLAIRLAFEGRSVPEVAAVMTEALPSNVERLRAFLQPYQDSGALRADIRLELVAEVFFGLTSSLVVYRLATRQALPEGDQIKQLADEVMELFWRGAGPVVAAH